MSLVLKPLSTIFKGIVKARQMYYQKFIKPEKFPVKIISVGNITTGGTGKTPFVDLLCKKIYHKRVAILSRGYKRKTHGFYKVDIKNPKAPEIFGDEPVMLAEKNNHIQVFVCEDRIQGIQKILAADDGIDIIILDDALQNFRVYKDLEFVIIDLTEKKENYAFLPEGRARVSLDSISQNQFIIFTKSNIASNSAWIENQLGSFRSAKLAYDIPRVSSALADGSPVYLISGIGKPDNFEKLASHKFKIIKHFKFPDHFCYTESLLSEISNEVKETPIITTEKDFVKISRLSHNLRVMSLRTDFVIVHNEKVFDAALTEDVLR